MKIFLLNIALFICGVANTNFADKVAKWTDFVERRQASNLPLIPFPAVATLVEQYLSDMESNNPILDLGCETGKNALCLIQAGHRVTLLDIAPNAVEYTIENLKAAGCDQGIESSIIGRIEELDSNVGPFKAIVGTYVFSFIPPELFETIMKNNVLGRIEENGFFAGGFFGEEHCWADEPELSIMTKEKLEELFISSGFLICEMTEKKDMKATVYHGEKLFHRFEVIAQKK